MLKGVAQEDHGEHAVCCHHTDHNAHCSTSLHYCLDELQPFQNNVAADANLFEDASTVRYHLPVIMSMGISSIPSCGLQGHLQDKLPSFDIS